MYFSSKHFYNYLNMPQHELVRANVRRTLLQPMSHNPPVTRKEVRDALRKAMEIIVERDPDELYRRRLAKWYRPWDVVPSLANFSAPENDFSVGVEVEMDFISQDSARFIANKLIKWRHVTIDLEGGRHPIEATFPPFLYSKLSNKTQVIRYIKMLADNRGHVVDAIGVLTGTHVNVGCSSMRLFLSSWRGSQRLSSLNSIISNISFSQQVRYFGRQPYGVGYARASFVEWKLFQSTCDAKRVKSYIHIAVALTKLLISDVNLTRHSVIDALEGAYRKVYKQD